MKIIKAAFATMSPAERWMYRKINGLISVCGFCGLMFGLLRNDPYDYKLGALIILYTCFVAVALWEENYKENKND